MDITSEERIVAYVDVIGWSEAFDTIGHDALVTVARSIADHKAKFSPSLKADISTWDKSMNANHDIIIQKGYYGINFSFVSDNFVVSAPKEYLKDLLSVTKWACMCLLVDHGFPTRGGITFGIFTHDMEHDIAIGKPLVEAVDIEKHTHMPRVTLSDTVRQLVDCNGLSELIYFDGEKWVLNIANVSDVWLSESRRRIKTALASGLDESKAEKWNYLAEHLPKMASDQNKA